MYISREKVLLLKLNELENSEQIITTIKEAADYTNVSWICVGEFIIKHIDKSVEELSRIIYDTAYELSKHLWDAEEEPPNYSYKHFIDYHKAILKANKRRSRRLAPIRSSYVVRSHLKSYQRFYKMRTRSKFYTVKKNKS